MLTMGWMNLLGRGIGLEHEHAVARYVRDFLRDPVSIDYYLRTASNAPFITDPDNASLCAPGT
jgi:hypothetical protein